MPDYLELENDIVRQKLDNNKLKQRNKVLYADTDDLKAGVEAIEERARNELGLIKEGETFFRIISQNKDKNRHRNKSNVDGVNNVKEIR